VSGHIGQCSRIRCGRNQQLLMPLEMLLTCFFSNMLSFLDGVQTLSGSDLGSHQPLPMGHLKNLRDSLKQDAASVAPSKGNVREFWRIDRSGETTLFQVRNMQFLFVDGRAICASQE
jgi:hypothetical protein